jgi:hypothetical protein
MKNHVLRPLWVVLAGIALLLVVRHFMVPDDFGKQGESFTYNFHRASNVDEWKDFKVKYRGREYCQECHEENVESILGSPHEIIQCENCHGPAIDHPDNPEALAIDTSRAQCLRCHSYLPYPTSQRSELPGIDPKEHNTDSECIECHNPHNPDLENM